MVFMMKEQRVRRVLAALEAQGLSQMLVTDPMSVYYLTGVYVQPCERFFGLLLRRDGKHALFLNRLFTVPDDVGIEKVWYADTDPVTDLIARQHLHCGTFNLILFHVVFLLLSDRV